MGVRMDVLGVLACLLGSVIVLSQRVWDWGVLLLALALAGASLVIHSRQKGFIIFRPAPETRPSPPFPVYESNHELSVRASGYFAIRDQVRYLANHQATLTTPASREHVLMARLEQSRFLLFGKSRSSDWGWWYQFIPATAITAVAFGTVTHGWRRQLALKASYWVQDGQDKDELVETVLSFDT